MKALEEQLEYFDSDFKIKFDGQTHQISANIFINSLMHTTTIIEEISRYYDSGKKIEIKINALEKGSFLVHIELIETVVASLKSLFTTDNIKLAAEIIGAFVGLTQLKKFLGGKNPKHVDRKGNKYRIENENGNVIIVENLTYNIYQSSALVKDALSQNFENLENDPSISGFEITDRDENTLIRVDKDEFPLMYVKKDEISDGERIVIEAATLNIVRLSFEGNLKWDFYFKGNKISARITDAKFYELIDKGETFAKGDILEVDLQIVQKWDESVNTFVNKLYQVNKILRHTPRGDQYKLF